MAISSTDTFKSTKAQVINDAFQTLTIYGVGESVSAEDYTFASRVLNRMIKAWGADGLHLWTKTEAVLLFDQYRERYSLGFDARAVNADELVTNRLRTDTLLAETLIEVDSVVGMSVNDNIGIVLNDRSLFWTTIIAINDADNAILLAAGLPIASTQGFLVYTYSTTITKPMKILEYARVASGFDSGQYSTLVEVPVSSQAYMDYKALSTKTSNASHITQFMYNPYVDYGNLYVFPRPSDCSYRLNFTYERRLADIIDASDNFDFPSEWEEAIVYQLAMRLARPFGRAAALQDIAPMADIAYTKALQWDSEKDYLDISPCNWE